MENEKQKDVTLKTLQVPVPESLFILIENFRKEEDRESIAGSVRYILRRYLAEREKEKINCERQKIRKDRAPKERFGTYNNIKLTPDEMKRLLDVIPKLKLDALIDRMSGYCSARGIRYKSHYAALLNWHDRDGGARKVKPTPPVDPIQEEVQLEEMRRITEEERAKRDEWKKRNNVT